MSQPAIEIKNLSKVYNIGHEKKAMKGSSTLRDAITRTIKKPIELITGHKLCKEKFWALKDVSFNIEKGDVVGIIGRNGSGKSTLLKILSKIVEPTEGEIIMRGKVASLLEVGTGFHPELTGRENIFFNGAILGMKRKEIVAKFDEIVEFSEVEKFLDTPVKFYSSGMYVRLAFSVAAHLEPDVLIVDEVLAVGDAAFQKKCLGKMKDVAGQGRTVLFVSHSMDSVANLCNKGVLLSKGKIVSTGPIEKVIRDYSTHQKASGAVNKISYTKTPETPHIDQVLLQSPDDKKKIIFKAYEDITVAVDVVVNNKNEDDIVCAIGIQTATDSPVRTAWSDNLKLTEGVHRISFNLNDVFLEPGDYMVIASLSVNGSSVQYVENAAVLTVQEVKINSKKAGSAQRLSNVGLVINQPEITVKEL